MGDHPPQLLILISRLAQILSQARHMPVRHRLAVPPAGPCTWARSPSSCPASGIACVGAAQTSSMRIWSEIVAKGLDGIISKVQNCFLVKGNFVCKSFFEGQEILLLFGLPSLLDLLSVEPLVRHKGQGLHDRRSFGSLSAALFFAVTFALTACSAMQGWVPWATVRTHARAIILGASVACSTGKYCILDHEYYNVTIPILGKMVPFSFKNSNSKSCPYRVCHSQIVGYLRRYSSTL